MTNLKMSFIEMAKIACSLDPVGKEINFNSVPNRPGWITINATEVVMGKIRLAISEYEKKTPEGQEFLRQISSTNTWLAQHRIHNDNPSKRNAMFSLGKFMGMLELYRATHKDEKIPMFISEAAEEFEYAYSMITSGKPL